MGEADPLVSNGLGSPTCQQSTAGELALANRRNCETSGFAESAAPTGNYGIDVHIDTGVLGLGAWVDSTLQDVVVAQVWMGLVWGVHALVVMLEWSFTLDLLPSSATAGLGRGLNQMEGAFTQPWLPLVLAAASIVVAYNGLVRRRVADTLGESALMVLMMLSALWVISDPQGTVGALGGWANQAAMGTLAVAAQGSPTNPGNAFADNLSAVFAAAVEVPWCYLEFGDVGWCRESRRLDPRLHSAALGIAASELRQIGCASDEGSSGPCVPSGSVAARRLQQSAEMLRDARSNGAIFLALPPNGPGRNSINEQRSLLHAICLSSDATNCKGPAAAQAQFRTGAHTWSRVCGLLLIVAGTLGMLLLYGFLALRLLAAALFSLLYLLLAPAIVLVPAFGESGRSLFRKWGLHLLGTVVAKLVFSFLLGVVLALSGMISGLTALGWWTQWLLMSTLWWGAFTRRHQVLGLLTTTSRSERSSRSAIRRRMGNTIEEQRRSAVERWKAHRRSKRSAPEVKFPTTKPLAQGNESSTKSTAAATSPSRPTGQRRAPKPGAPENPDRRPSALLEQLKQLGRVRRAGEEATAAGDRRRTIELATRERRIEDELLHRQGRSSDRQESQPEDAQRGRGEDAGADGSAREGRRGGQRPSSPRGPDMRGQSPARSGRLDADRTGEARQTIDRELATREELSHATGRTREHDELPERTAQRERPQDIDVPVPEGAAPQEQLPRRSRAQESSVMRDVREVEAGRKRQLGLNRP